MWEYATNRVRVEFVIGLGVGVTLTRKYILRPTLSRFQVRVTISDTTPARRVHVTTSLVALSLIVNSSPTFRCDKSKSLSKFLSSFILHSSNFSCLLLIHDGYASK